jgi:hypothetical protein
MAMSSCFIEMFFHVTSFEGLAKPIKASGISSQNGQKKKIAGPKVIK